MNERDTCTPPTDPVIAWCCRHKWTLAYITVVVTLLLIFRLLETFAGWPG